jgi:tripeptide aminopeptidase
MRMRPAHAIALLFAGLALGAAAPQSPAARVARVMSDDRFLTAMAAIDRDHDRLVSDIIALTEIPAPPFNDDRRAAAYLERLRQAGLSDVERDEVGNVMGVRRGPGSGPLVAVAAHLDTVFPEGTPVKVTRTGTRLAAPGVGDDTRSLAVLLAIIRGLDAAGVQTTSDILFVGDVGEEGPGDLRGMKYLFGKGKYAGRIRAFISIDGAGAGDVITNGALGSRRYRVTFRGPGGHSYTAFGLVSPAFALGRAIDKFQAMPVPSRPKTTFNVGVMGGGTSVNSIPYESWMEVDMRSESRAELEKVNETFIGLMHDAADEENRARSTAEGRITVDLKLVGDRPSGETPPSSEIVQIASAVIRSLGMTPQLDISSTDANVPISLGIPAITIDSGGGGDRAHALDEWIDVEKTSSLRGIRAALALLLTLAGLP